RRELSRALGIEDAVFSFAIGAEAERRQSLRDASAPVPRRIFIGGAPAAVVAALRGALTRASLDVLGATVVAESIRRLYLAAPRSAEPTAVLACLPSGAHLCFFIDGRLELAIEPAIGAEGDRLDPTAIVDELE